jgi:hypothetical protein
MFRVLILAGVASLPLFTGASAHTRTDTVQRDLQTQSSRDLKAHRVNPTRSQKDLDLEREINRALGGETDLESVIKKLLGEHDEAEVERVPLILGEQRVLAR